MRLLALLALAALAVHATDRPVIGILDQPLSEGSAKTYIAARYTHAAIGQSSCVLTPCLRVRAAM